MWKQRGAAVTENKDTIMLQPPHPIDLHAKYLLQTVASVYTQWLVLRLILLLIL